MGQNFIKKEATKTESKFILNLNRMWLKKSKSDSKDNSHDSYFLKEQLNELGEHKVPKLFVCLKGKMDRKFIPYIHDIRQY